jgi:hypothetical protein
VRDGGDAPQDRYCLDPCCFRLRSGMIEGLDTRLNDFQLEVAYQYRLVLSGAVGAYIQRVSRTTGSYRWYSN